MTVEQFLAKRTHPHMQTGSQISEWIGFFIHLRVSSYRDLGKGNVLLELHQMILNKRATHIVRHSMPGILHRKPPKLNCVILKG